MGTTGHHTFRNGVKRAVRQSRKSAGAGALLFLVAFRPGGMFLANRRSIRSAVALPTRRGKQYPMPLGFERPSLPPVPWERLKSECFDHPYGTSGCPVAIPALKGWAIFIHAFGTNNLESWRHWSGMSAFSLPSFKGY